MDRVQQLQAAGLRHGRSSALLFLDLEGFKQVNDIHGHEVGDQLLQEVAARLSACVRKEDTVARLGGHEFVVMLSELGTDSKEAVKQAQVVAGKLLVTLSKEHALRPVCCRCSASIGITLYGLQLEACEDILKRADRAMYDAKKSGRNASRVADPQQGGEAPRAT